VPADFVLFKSGFSDLQPYLQLLDDFEMDFPEVYNVKAPGFRFFPWNFSFHVQGVVWANPKGIIFFKGRE